MILVLLYLQEDEYYRNDFSPLELCSSGIIKCSTNATQLQLVNPGRARYCSIWPIGEVPFKRRCSTLARISNTGLSSGICHRVVENYSSMKLTFQDDVLPTISRVAHRIQDLTGSKYYAGLWSHAILKDLQWLVGNNQQSRRRQDLAPTWS